MARKNMTAKIAAIVALIAIIWSIIGTGVLVIYQSYFSSPNSETSLTQEQLQELLNSFSWSTSSWELIENTDETSTWDTNEINQ